LLHPLYQRKGCEVLVGRVHSLVLDDLVKVSNTLDPSLKVATLKTHECYFELQNFCLLFSLFLSDKSPLEVVDALYNAFNLLPPDVPQLLLWSFPETLDASFNELWSVILNEILVVDDIGV
jgi:hypothetical protein